jgi:hypothetical protein
LGVKTTAWKYDGVHYWKQVIQFRPDSGDAEVIQCDTQQIDAGDLAWRKPAHRLKSLTVIDSKLELWVHRYRWHGIASISADAWWAAARSPTSRATDRIHN